MFALSLELTILRLECQLLSVLEHFPSLPVVEILIGSK
jgi:hypothetical protein